MKNQENIPSSGPGQSEGLSQTVIPPGFGLFRTDVQEASQGNKLVKLLLSLLPGGEISFDLEDCDRVLRIKHDAVQAAGIISVLKGQGFNCEELKW